MMNNQIKILRKTIGLTQQEFAERLKISRNTVATYEIGKSNPSDAAVTLICREFNVNETWLREGNGEMFLDMDTSLLSQLATKYRMDAEQTKLMQNFLSLSTAQRAAIVKLVQQLATGLVEFSNPTTPPTIELTAEEAEAALEAARHEKALREGYADTSGDATDPEIEEAVSKYRSRLLAREKTRQALTGSMSTASAAANEKSRP